MTSRLGLPSSVDTTLNSRCTPATNALDEPNSESVSLAAASTPSPPRAKRQRRPPSLEQREMSRRRSQVYYAHHKHRVLAKLKLKYEQQRSEIRAKRRELYYQRKLLQTTTRDRYSLEYILN